jgi:RNA polymerase sigma factor (sigma-70 family)
MSSSERADVLLAEAAGGDADAFAAFFSETVEAVLRYFAVRVRDPESAADLMAETFAAALLGARRYRPGGSGAAYAWLFAIARSKLVDHARRGAVQRRARERLALEPVDLDDADLERVCELADLERTRPLLPTLLADLPAEQREALLDRVVEEQPYSEIASRMNSSEALARKRVSRALEQLRRALRSAP